MYRFAFNLSFALLVSIQFILPARAQEDVISVRILEQARPTSIVVEAAASALDVFAGDFDQPIGTIERGDEASISHSSGQLSIVVDGVRLFADELRVRGASSLLLRMNDENPNAPARMLPGELRIRPAASHLMLDNVLDLEAYVASVVSHEYSFDDIEGSKAMAIVARTYALKRMQSDAPLTDHIGSQVYGDERRVTNIARRAADETRGQILTHDGNLIEAVYSSSSGGMTANNEDVWEGGPLPYLRSRNDPFDRDSPHRTWTARVDRDRLLRAMSRELGMTASGFITGDRGPDGRVRTVELLSTSGPGKEITANRFRLIVNREFGVHSLKSTSFDARRQGNEYVFDGSGFGHGVGLNQHGARYLAAQGYSYRDILGFYYTDVRLATHRDGRPAGTGEALAPDPRLLADAGESMGNRPASNVPMEAGADDVRVADHHDEPVVREEGVTSRPQPAPRRSTPRTGKRIGW